MKIMGRINHLFGHSQIAIFSKKEISLYNGDCREVAVCSSLPIISNSNLNNWWQSFKPRGKKETYCSFIKKFAFKFGMWLDHHSSKNLSSYEEWEDLTYLSATFLTSQNPVIREIGREYWEKKNAL